MLAFETEIAKASWAAAERRDIDKVYNPMTVDALQKFAPAIEWRAYLDAAGLSRSPGGRLHGDHRGEKIARSSPIRRSIP